MIYTNITPWEAKYYYTQHSLFLENIWANTLAKIGTSIFRNQVY